MDVPGLADVLSDEGWTYASAPPVDDTDPGRYHALFGRDSLVTALQLLPVRPDVARATLRALATLQGQRDDPATEEQPGRIGHEFRPNPPESFVRAGWSGRGEFRYYGTNDATSWFLIVLAELGEPDLTAELDAAWRGAADWLHRTIERGGGLVRPAATARGALTQEGWRDTIDPRAGDGGGVLRADGTPPRLPLADADTQAVAVAALGAAHRLSGDAVWAQRADAMRRLVSARFGPEVMALEADDTAVSGAGSQLGWLLWARALDEDTAGAAAERLTRADVLTAYGLRTLSSDSPVFDPEAYHRGSVWPFDSWLGWGGLLATGREPEAERVRTGVLDAIGRLGRFPELYVVQRDGSLAPSGLSTRVQAWTVGASWALAHYWTGRAG